jgi:hypothetical protein
MPGREPTLKWHPSGGKEQGHRREIAKLFVTMALAPPPLPRSSRPAADQGECPLSSTPPRPAQTPTPVFPTTPSQGIYFRTITVHGPKDSDDTHTHQKA